MKLLYRGPKWEKEIKRIEVYKKDVKGNLKVNIERCVQDFLKKGGDDYLEMYFLLDGKFKLYAQYSYLDNALNEDIAKNVFLSAISGILARYLYKSKKCPTEYPIEIMENSFAREEDSLIFRMLSVEKIPASFLEMEKDNLIMKLHLGNYQDVSKMVEQLPDEPDESREGYFDNSVFLKKIYQAILDKNEKAFNEEIEKRIKKYRRNMVGYSTIIDYVSIALIKLAEREGIHCNVDVIEIPKQFFDKELLGKLDIHELPYFDECLKTGMLDGFKWD